MIQNDFINAETAYSMSINSHKYKKLLDKIENLIRTACEQGYFKTTFTRDTELPFEICSMLCLYGYEIKKFKTIKTSDKNNIVITKFDYTISWSKPNTIYTHIQV